LSNIVFILGAGASRQGGAPLMTDFLDVASDLLRANKTGDRRVEFEKVFSAIGSLQAVHSKAQLDLYNIESIFTVLELGKIIRKVPGLSGEEISETIAALKELIVKTLEVTLRFSVMSDGLHSPAPYDQFAKLLRTLSSEVSPSMSTSVITFNYDIALDMAMHRGRLGPDYVISEPGNAEILIPLLKLHGSLNWATNSETSEIIPIHFRDYLPHFRVPPGADRSKSIMIPIGSQLQEFFSKNGGPNVNREPVIVPPSWNKGDYHAALSDVWSAAADHLSEAEYIFVIGYSLPDTDSFFRHLYALGSVGSSPLRRIDVFNPDSSGLLDKRFRGLLGPGATERYAYHEKTFEEAIGFIDTLFPGR
jgi:hypothetical protein